MPGGPFKLSEENLERTVYLASRLENAYIESLYLEKFIPDLGNALWTIKRNDPGAPFLYGRINYENSNNWEDYSIYALSLTSPGTFRYDITCTIGAYSQTIPLTLTVFEEIIPTGLAMPKTLFTAKVNESIIIPRPTLLPAGTGFDATLFAFNLWGSSENFWDNIQEYEDGANIKVSFSAPGFYIGSVRMEYGSVDLWKDVAFVIKNADGTLPAGSPVRFRQASVERTFHAGGSGTLRLSVWLEDDITAFGNAVWSVKVLSGNSANATIDYENLVSTRGALMFTALGPAGDTNFSVTCSVAGYSASIDILLHVTNLTLPTALQVEKTHYDAKAGEPFTIPRPALLPVGTGLAESEFDFSIGFDSPFDEVVDFTDEGDQLQKELTFNTPGYYYAYIGMHCDNIYFEQSISFAVADSKGVLPPIVPIKELQLSKSGMLTTVGVESGYTAHSGHLDRSS